MDADAAPLQKVAPGEHALWLRLRGDDDSARAALLELHLPYARTVAATYYRRRVHDEIEFDDYLQFARLGMVEAMQRFDPDQGALFRTFAARRMHGAILDGLERCTEKQQQIAARQRLQKERLADLRHTLGPTRHADDLFRHLADVGIGLALCHLLEGTGMVDLGETASNADPAADEAGERHYASFELAQLKRRLVALVDRLAPQQRTVIRYHYLQEHSFEDVAHLMGVTRGRVSQIHRAALAALRDALAAEGHVDLHF